MPEQLNIEIVKSIYAAFGRGDIQGVLGVLADDVDWQFFGPPEIPFAGNFKGRAQVAEKFFAVLGQTTEARDFGADKFVAQGDVVCALGYERFLVKGTGREWIANWVHVHTLSDGKVRHFREYSDTAAIRYAYGK